MTHSEPSKERRRTQDGMVTTVRDHLRTLVSTVPTAFPCRYACFIHPRRRVGEHGFGVITLAGESLPLTVTLLESLRRMPTLLEGTDPVVVGAADEEDSLVPGTPRADWQEPLPVTRIMLWHGVDAGSGTSALRQRTGVMLTPKATGPQLILLCAERPIGWPA
jgi:hypothetical protein